MTSRSRKDVIVSATGTWRSIQDPASRKDRSSLPSALGIRDAKTLASVKEAVHRAANTQAASVLPLAQGTDLSAEVLHVRPARESGHAVLSFNQLDAAPPIDPQLLRDLFSLSATEAEIASELLHTDELRDIAVHRGVALETVRMHVKNLLRKTGQPNQKRLAALLTRLAILSRPPDTNTGAR